MVYRFIILSDESDDFRRDILIDSDATFYELHEAILDSVGYTREHPTSFFICDDNWEKRTEITLVEMDTSSDVDSYVMDNTHLSNFLDEERQKLLYVFDYLTDRAFFMELREIITGKDQPKAECIRANGKPPVQSIDFDEFDKKVAAAALHNEEDFFDSGDDFNLDEYDEEDMGGLSEGNPFEDY
ncbi:MAG: plasmid pRiA4b ORF-3 family protein [Dysgonamonadaceae bacterium]|jgi:hypothetical protein|nr:plasmid pRiA4b ORF-3 family protein [Dysgonamonadaceae bacterium]